MNTVLAFPPRATHHPAAIGSAALSEAELLTLWLGGGRRGRRHADLAQALLRAFGSVRGILSASPDRLAALPGMGTARATQIQVILELARRHHREALLNAPRLTDPLIARDYLQAELRDLAYEAFCLIYLDSRYRVTGFETLFRGTIDCAQVHPREVVRRALEVRAVAVILCHNHPSGIAEPSEADKIITTRLRDALALVDIRVLDHLIVADEACISLAERGLV